MIHLDLGEKIAGAMIGIGIAIKHIYLSAFTIEALFIDFDSLKFVEHTLSVGWDALVGGAIGGIILHIVKKYIKKIDK